MRRRLLTVLGALVVVGAIYFLLFGDSSVDPQLTSELPTSAIGEGEGAVGVSAAGLINTEAPAPEDGTLPLLPISAPPKNGRLQGHMLEQARILGAAPAALRSCVAGSYYGESGIDVKLRSGIELRFGDATRAEEKWDSAAAVLANPQVTALDYVDLHSPRHPATGGSSHSLPAPGEGSAEGCGG